MRRIIGSIAAFALLFMPLFASADQLSDLQAKLQSLLSQAADVQQQISALQAQPASPTTGTAPSQLPVCSMLSYRLSIGSTDKTTGDEVTALQKALAADPTLYPEGLVTGYFGPATNRAFARLSARCAMNAASVPVLPAAMGASSAQPTPAASSTPFSSLVPALSIDASSLVATSSTPTITGSSKNVLSLFVIVESADAVAYRSSVITPVGGKWQVTTSALPAGSYGITARTLSGDALAAGTFVIYTPLANTATTTPASLNPYLNSGGVIASSTVSAPVPMVTMTANGSPRGATVTPGSSALLGWNSTNATSCSIASMPATRLSGVVMTAGSGISPGPLLQTTVFTVACTGSGGMSSGSITVTVR